MEDATMYTTMSPCFGCLNEGIQTGVSLIVYQAQYEMKVSCGLEQQYDDMAKHLRAGDFTGFEPLGGEVIETTDTAPVGYDEPASD